MCWKYIVIFSLKKRKRKQFLCESGWAAGDDIVLKRLRGRLTCRYPNEKKSLFFFFWLKNSLVRWERQKSKFFLMYYSTCWHDEAILQSIWYDISIRRYFNWYDIIFYFLLSISFVDIMTSREQNKGHIIMRAQKRTYSEISHPS